MTLSLEKAHPKSAGLPDSVITGTPIAGAHPAETIPRPAVAAALDK